MWRKGEGLSKSFCLRHRVSTSLLTKSITFKSNSLLSSSCEKTALAIDGMWPPARIQSILFKPSPNSLVIVVVGDVI